MRPNNDHTFCGIQFPLDPFIVFLRRNQGAIGPDRPAELRECTRKLMDTGFIFAGVTDKDIAHDVPKSSAAVGGPRSKTSRNRVSILYDFPIPESTVIS